MAEDHAEGSRDAGCGVLLCGRRHVETAVASPAGTAGVVSEVSQRVSDLSS